MTPEQELLRREPYLLRWLAGCMLYPSGRDLLIDHLDLSHAVLARRLGVCVNTVAAWRHRCGILPLGPRGWPKGKVRK